MSTTGNRFLLFLSLPLGIGRPPMPLMAYICEQSRTFVNVRNSCSFFQRSLRLLYPFIALLRKFYRLVSAAICCISCPNPVWPHFRVVFFNLPDSGMHASKWLDGLERTVAVKMWESAILTNRPGGLHKGAKGQKSLTQGRTFFIVFLSQFHTIIPTYPPFL